MHGPARFLVTTAATLGVIFSVSLRGYAGTPRPPASRPSPQEAADRVRTKVVVLKTVSGPSRGSATGFLVRPRLVMTTDHAVKPEARVTAWVNGVAYRADLLVSHPDYDVALLGLRAPNLLLKPAELAASSEGLEENEPLLVLAGPSQPANAQGDPDGRVPIPALFRGRVWLRLPNGKQGIMLRMDAGVQRGDSGSPIVRVRDGTVVGMLSSRELPDAEGLSRTAYAVPVEGAEPWVRAAAETLAKRDADAADFYLLGVLKK